MHDGPGESQGDPLCPTLPVKCSSGPTRASSWKSPRCPAVIAWQGVTDCWLLAAVQFPFCKKLTSVFSQSVTPWNWPGPLIWPRHWLESCQPHQLTWLTVQPIVQELCERRGGRPGLSVLTSLLVSMDVKIYWTVLRHWSQLVPKSMSTDIWGH